MEKGNITCALSNDSTGCCCSQLCNNTSGEESVDVFRGSYLQIITCVYLILAAFAALLGNGLVMLTVCKRRNLHQNSYFLVANLALRDFAFAIVICFMAIPATFHGSWHLGACIFYAFITRWLSYTELVLLTAIGLDRYIACVYALRYHEIMTSRRLCIVLVFCWAYGFVWALAPLFGFGRYVYIETSLNCALEYSLDTTVATYLGMLTFCLLLPGSGLIIYFYAALYRTSRQVAPQPSLPSQPEGPITDTQARPRKATRTVSLVTGVYFLCWLPAVTMSVTRACVPDFETYYVLTTFDHVTKLIFTVAIYANPIIYGIYNKHFRQEVRLVFTM